MHSAGDILPYLPARVNREDSRGRQEFGVEQGAPGSRSSCARAESSFTSKQRPFADAADTAAMHFGITSRRAVGRFLRSAR